MEHDHPRAGERESPPWRDEVPKDSAAVVSKTEGSGECVRFVLRDLASGVLDVAVHALLVDDGHHAGVGRGDDAVVQRFWDEEEDADDACCGDGGADPEDVGPPELETDVPSCNAAEERTTCEEYGVDGLCENILLVCIKETLRVLWMFQTYHCSTALINEKDLPNQSWSNCLRGTATNSLKDSRSENRVV